MYAGTGALTAYPEESAEVLAGLKKLLEGQDANVIGWISERSMASGMVKVAGKAAIQAFVPLVLLCSQAQISRNSPLLECL